MTLEACALTLLAASIVIALCARAQRDAERLR